MHDHPSQPTGSPLVTVTVAGSPTLHRAPESGYTTLCGRVAVFRHRYMPRRSACRTCAAIESTRRKADQ